MPSGGKEKKANHKLKAEKLQKEIGVGGCRLEKMHGSHFPGQITKAISPSAVRFGQLSSTDNAHLSEKFRGWRVYSKHQKVQFALAVSRAVR